MKRVLPNAQAIDAHINMGKVHIQLQQAAIAVHGACTKKFDQGSGDSRVGMRYLAERRSRITGDRWRGSCKALSICWLGFHATDRDFWGWLNRNGWSRADAVGKIFDLQENYRDHIRYGSSKDNWSAQVLKENFGVIEKRNICDLASLKATGAAVVKNRAADMTANIYDAGWSLAKVFAPDRGGSSEGYRQLSFHGDNSGHAVAAWVGQDVAFFDPNFGEYWFESPAGFREWFRYYWAESGYGAKYQRSYAINHYAKAVTFPQPL